MIHHYSELTLYLFLFYSFLACFTVSSAALDVCWRAERGREGKKSNPTCETSFWCSKYYEAPSSRNMCLSPPLSPDSITPCRPLIHTETNRAEGLEIDVPLPLSVTSLPFGAPTPHAAVIFNIQPPYRIGKKRTEWSKITAPAPKHHHHH